MKTLLSCSAAMLLAFSGYVAQRNGVLHNPPWAYLFGNHIDTHQES